MKCFVPALFVSFLALLPLFALGFSDTQKMMIQNKFVAGGLKCIKDNPLSMDDIKSFRSKMLPEGENAKCFAACLFKKIGIMDDMGKLTQSGALQNARKIFQEDEHLNKVKEIISTCSKVNDQTVGDGEKGCDRAKLAFSCLTENAPKFGFDMNF